MPYVVDASVVVKWFFPEPHHDKAKGFLRDFINQDVALIAPDLITGEIGNALWKRSVLIRDISVQQARDAYSYFLAFGLPLYPSSSFAARGLSLAIQELHPVYDALYVALAEERGCELITADERFVRKMSGRFSCVRWLGDF
jgi:predicted nucleic acid-binding protein